MPSQHNHKGIDPGLDLVSGEQVRMQSEREYRDLEHDYHQSAQYASIRQRYAQLRYWIGQCDPGDLVADDPPQQIAVSSGLLWERSHGES